VPEISIFRRKRGDDDSKTGGKHGQVKKDKGKSENRPGWPDRSLDHKVICVEDHKCEELDEGRDKVREHLADRHGESRKVDLSEEPRVDGKSVHRVRELRLKIMPEHGPAVIKERVRNAFCPDIRQFPKNESVDYRCEERLENEPERTEDGLLVDRLDVPLREKHDKITIVPDLLKVEGEEFSARFYNRSPLALIIATPRTRTAIRFHFLRYLFFRHTPYKSFSGATGLLDSSSPASHFKRANMEL